MIIVTAGTAEYRPIVDAQARKCKALGYGHIIYDLGGLGIGEPFAVEREDLEPTVNGDSLPPATFKPTLVRRAMEQAGEDEAVCWLDADCIPLCAFEPAGAWDAAVTLRAAGEVGQSNNPALDYLNSGVVWIRNNTRGSVFLETWRSASTALRTDQGGLNEAVAPVVRGGFNRNDWIASVGHALYAPSGARVLVLDAMQWNRWHLPPEPTTRILHFKRGIRAAAVNYL